MLKEININLDIHAQPIVFRRVVVISLIVMFLLLPVQFPELPFNFSFVELWNLVVISLSAVYLLKVRAKVWLPYIVPMWLIFIASFLSTINSPDVTESLTVIIKEIYIYVWFLILVAILNELGTFYTHLLLKVWVGVLLLHAFLIISQFIFTDFFVLTQQMASNFGGSIDQWRVSGLFKNANAAAFYQLMGFAPLLVVVKSRKYAISLGAIVLFSIFATGSMGAMVAFLFGSIVAGITYFIFYGNQSTFVRFLVGTLIISLFVISITAIFLYFNPEFLARLQANSVGRLDRSADGRFALWIDGINIFKSNYPFWGVGPDGFTFLGQRKNFLHNDSLAFFVERGLMGIFGLFLLAIYSILKGLQFYKFPKKESAKNLPLHFVFLGLIFAVILYSQTHQIFHARSLWLVIAVQEVLLFRYLSATQTS